MKNPTKNNPSFLQGYFMFVLATIALGTISMIILIFFIIEGNQKSKFHILKKESSNIHHTISEIFNYSNKINSYLGEEIAEHGAHDLDFILKIFRQTDQIQHKNSRLLSWSSFDWVDVNHRQRVNSKVGIRKEPPNMSNRQYSVRSPKNPWTLQVSFPVLGNPSKSWVIPAGTGITDKNGKYLGTIVVGFNIAELSSLMTQRLNDPISFVVLDENMNIIIQSQDNDFIRNNDFFKKNINQDLLPNNFGILDKNISAGDIIYSYYRKFDDYPYIVLTGFNQSFLNKEFNHKILPIVVGFISMICFFLIILYIFKTRILLLLKREKILNEHNQSKTNLIRGVSHDLRNYIFGIFGMSKLILHNKKTSEIENDEDLKIVKEISDQSEELMGFVEDLLDTNHNQSGEFSLGQMQSCNLAKLVQRMVVLNKNYAIESRISLEAITTDKEELNIKCDIRRIKQILNNLISNAIKYSPINTKVTIKTSLINHDEICLLIEDNGIGMTKDEIRLALSGYGEQIDKSNLNKEIDSHGIGMSIIKRLVELHHGRLEIDSKKNHGTKVRVYFKRYIGDQIAHGEILITGLHNKSIILAEDNPVSNKINTFLLRKLGFHVKHVENGQELLDELDKGHFDLVFMDINMPILDGFLAAEQIRKGTKFKKFNNNAIPIIAISANEIDPAKLTYYGINASLQKPFLEKDLLDFVLEYTK